MSVPLTRHDIAGVDAPATRIDLHLHSRASTDTGSWFLSRALMPESFVDPAEAYAACKRRGMDLVTLTDHNTISGALEIAHHPDVIVGVEITAVFPDDGVPMHVLAWGITERLWADLDRARENIFDLVDLLDERQVPCALAHPLHRVGETLSVEHLELCLLLFRMWEGRNGARPRQCNEVASRIAAAASPALLARLADKHDLAPRASGPPALPPEATTMRCSRQPPRGPKSPPRPRRMTSSTVSGRARSPPAAHTARRRDWRSRLARSRSSAM